MNEFIKIVLNGRDGLLWTQSAEFSWSDEYFVLLGFLLMSQASKTKQEC